MPANGRPRISRKRGPKRAYSKRLARYPRKAAGKLGSKRLRSISGRRRLRGYASGGLVTKTGPAVLHAGEYVTNAATPHPFKTAVVNPFAVSGVRIPDETSFSTFTLTQTTTNTISPIDLPINNGATPPVVTDEAYVCGLRMRPSMADGSTFMGYGSGSNATLMSDMFNPCIAFVTHVESGAASKSLRYSWQAAFQPYVTSTNFLQSNYVWGTPRTNGIAASANLLYVDRLATPGSGYQRVLTPASDCRLSTIEGPMGYALQNGAKCRPVAWGMRIRYGGLKDSSNNINPYGKLYFGIHLPEDQGNNSGQGQYDTMPVYDGAKQADGAIYTGGPGNDINFSQLESDAVRKNIGCITMDQLRSLPDGLIIGTGPRSASERLFYDVDYASGTDRCVEISDTTGQQTAQEFTIDGFTVNGTTQKLRCWSANLSTYIGSQPWFILKDALNVKLVVESIIHWEVVPSAIAFTLPGTCKAEMSNTAIMDAASNIMGVVQNNPMLLVG